MDRLVDLEDSERADELPVRRFQGHLPVRTRERAQGVHDIPLQPRSVPGCARQREGPQEHDVPLHARGWLRHRGQRRRGNRVRRRDAHCSEPLRRPQRGLLREALRITMARITIDKKIVKYSVAKDEEPAKAVPEVKPDPESNVIRMHEKLERPEVLIGSTYKVKTPVSDHAMYVTINDIVLNEGTPHEQRRPFEIFINSKNLDHYQWIVALTRIMSAVFRKIGRASCRERV